MPESPPKKERMRAQVVHNKYVNVDLLKNEEMQDYFRYLTSTRRIFLSNFLAGTARGLGFVIGTVLVIALVTFMVSRVLAEIPWIGEIFRWMDDWLRENIESYSL